MVKQVFKDEKINKAMYIDCHVHLRDFEKQRHKETIRHGLEVAGDSGVDAVFDMPNTNPSVTTEEIVNERLKLADDNETNVFYAIYIGATANSEQLKRAVELHRKLFPRVCGIKLYAGESVGDLAVINPIEQMMVYGTLAEEGYNGILAVHAEKEDEMNKNIWKYNYPISHCIARPPESEIASVNDQIIMAKYTKFKGKLHIAHISCPEAVDLVVKAKSEGIDISCGACPHHLFYDWNKMFDEKGILWKMNPPLRPLGYPDRMLENLKDEKIDWIETDHAPHTLEEKTSQNFMSGIPGLPWWPLFAEYLKRNNFSDDLIKRVTYSNILKRFEIDIKRNVRQIKDRRKDYPFNPYEDLERKIGWN